MNKKQVIYKKLFYSFLIFLFSLFLFFCDMPSSSGFSISPLANRPNAGTWYQIFVGSFFDSNGDGIGDLQGIIMKLDYLNDSHTASHARNIHEYGECNDSLHVSGIWLTPIHPSPSYHKYDVMDYMAIDPQFGTMDDFRELLRECHKRGIKLAIDMVMNHTSDQHPWFQKALEEIRSGKPGRYASYYHFYYGAIPPQRESVEYADWHWQWDGYWDNGVWVPDRGIRNRFYRCWGKVKDGVWWEGSFWTGMPDLNWDSHHLREEFEEIVRFWIGEGLDGYRLDAVHYFYDWIDIGQYEFGTIPHDIHDKNIKVLKWFTDICRAINPNVYLVGECWREIYGTPNDVRWSIIENYYRSGMDFFHFGAAEEIVKVLNGTSRGRDWASFIGYWDRRIKARNQNALIATFLSNHDKNRPFYWIGDEGDWDSRPTPSMRGDDRRRFAASLNLLAPGTPYIYYGEEIGIFHNNVDYWSNTGDNDYHEFTNGPPRRARDDSDWRGPMWWSNTNRVGIPNAPENRRWSLEAMQSRYGNGVEEQLGIEYSLLKHYIRLGNLKNRYPFIAWGRMQIIDTGNPDIAAWRIFDTWRQSPTFGKSAVVAHNANYDTDQTFILDNPMWIDGISSRDLTWLPSIHSDGRTINMPPYSSAVIGEYEWGIP